MIVVSRLNGSAFAVNPDLVERIHETPDTTLIMVDGAKYIVREPMADVIEMIAAYRARIVRLASEPAGLAEPHRAGESRAADGTRLTGPQPTLAPVAELHVRQEGGR